MPVRCTPSSVNQLPHIIKEALHELKLVVQRGFFSSRLLERSRGQMAYWYGNKINKVFQAALLLYLLGPLNCIDHFRKKVNLALKHFVY